MIKSVFLYNHTAGSVIKFLILFIRMKHLQSTLAAIHTASLLGILVGRKKTPQSLTTATNYVCSIINKI